MSNIRSQVNISAPNLVNVCVDEVQGGEISGRLYHCYSDSAEEFCNVIELLRNMENLFDRIAFPQASTKGRSFVPSSEPARRIIRPDKVIQQQDLLEFRGEIGTFIVNVRYRQNSTWQGEMFWVEQEQKRFYNNTLDFIKLVDIALHMSRG